MKHWSGLLVHCLALTGIAADGKLWRLWVLTSPTFTHTLSLCMYGFVCEVGFHSFVGVEKGLYERIEEGLEVGVAEMA